MKRLLIAYLILIFPLPGIAQAPVNYDTTIENWHRQRVAELKSPTGWLNLEGLFWLRPGSNSFGSKTGNDIIYENPEMPAVAGEFILDGQKVVWISNSGTVLINGEKQQKATIFNPDSSLKPSVRLGPFSWTIIKREEKIGVRFRNMNSKAMENFAGIERFPVDTSWIVSASLIPPSSDRIVVTNVLGQTNLEKTSGKLKFSINNKSYTLDILDEEGDELFIVFGDATNGNETYSSGRFIYVKKPAADGRLEIDFNKAINPPCAFTDFATCPIPPRQNVLPIAVTAGEKNYVKPLARK